MKATFRPGVGSQSPRVNFRLMTDTKPGCRWPPLAALVGFTGPDDNGSRFLTMCDVPGPVLSNLHH